MRTTTITTTFLSVALLAAGCNTSPTSHPNPLTASSPATGGSTGTSTGPTTPVRPVPMAFETIAQGDGSAINGREDHLLTAPQPFDTLWNRHTAGASPSPRFAFGTHAIVATFAGALGTPNHTTDVIALDRDDANGDVHALVRDFSPGSWKRQYAQRCSPFHMVSFARPTSAALSGRLVAHRQRDLDFEVIHAGANSLLRTEQVLVIRDFNDYLNFWATHTTDPMPVVDFASEMVVAIFAGEISSFGNSVEALRVLRDDDANEVRVDYRQHSYRGGAAPPPAIESPFQILRVTYAQGAIRRELRSAIAPTDLASGQDSLYTGSVTTAQVVRDQATLDGILQGQIGPTAPSITVDFTREQAIVAFLGTRASTAWDVQVAGVAMLEDGEIEMTVNTCAPMGRPMATPTSPWHIVKTAKTFGPSSTLVVDVTPRP